MIKKIIVCFLLIGFWGYLSAQSFEGSIFFLKETPLDTGGYIYHVKDNKIRIDELAGNDVINSLLINLSTEEIIALSPSRKLYMHIYTKKYIESDDSGFEIIENNDNVKNIKGFDCVQLRVRNKALNTDITYWVTKGEFSFFPKLLKILNRSDKHAVFYMKLPENAMFFPLLSVERTLLRDVKMRLIVTKIKRRSLEKTLFEIPRDYSNFEQ